MSVPDNIRHYLIPQIGRWQLAANENEVSLPALQRGFVWDAGRIESLWDSLLRGFPIGSFLLASNRSEKYPKDKAQAQDILNTFLKRLTFMYRDWYESLGIAELFPN